MFVVVVVAIGIEDVTAEEKALVSVAMRSLKAFRSSMALLGEVNSKILPGTFLMSTCSDDDDDVDVDDGTSEWSTIFNLGFCAASCVRMSEMFITSEGVLGEVCLTHISLVAVAIRTPISALYFVSADSKISF